MSLCEVIIELWGRVFGRCLWIEFTHVVQSYYNALSMVEFILILWGFFFSVCHTEHFGIEQLFKKQYIE